MQYSAFWIRESLEELRPSGLAPRKDDNTKGDTPNVSNILSGNNDFPDSGWRHPDLFASLRGSTRIEDWDFYETTCGFGVFSQNAHNLLQPFFGERFTLLPVSVEGHHYFTPRCEKRIDCLDAERSDIEFVEFDDGTTGILRIRRFAFYGICIPDPMIFAIPQKRFGLFCTETVARVVGDNGLTGFDFEECLITKRG